MTVRFELWDEIRKISGEIEKMNKILTKDKDYSAWLKELKTKVRLVQIKAAVKVNSELLWFYWELGQDIIDNMTFRHLKKS